MNNLEKLEQFRTQMQRLVRDFRTQAMGLGTPKDGEALRSRLGKLRQRWTELNGKTTTALNSAPTSGPDARDYEQLRFSITDLRNEYDAVDRDVRGKENANRIVANQSAAANGTGDDAPSQQGGFAHGGAGRRTQQTVRMQDFQRVDDAELLTEDALQTEKLEGILDVQRDMNELNSMYRELHSHVEGQQVGLDTAEHNIDKAQTNVEKGVTELKQANKLQKSSRKKMFILLAIVAVIIVVVIVVVVVMKKG